MDRPKIVEAIDRERRALENTGLRAVSPISKAIRHRILQAVRQGFDAPSLVRTEQQRLIALFVDGAVASHLSGLRRSKLVLLEKMSGTARLASSDPFGRAVALLQSRLNIKADDVRHLEAIYKPRIVKQLDRAHNAVERTLRQAIKDSVTEGDHVQAGVIRIAKAFDNAGLSFRNPFMFETLFRSELQLAYSAGRISQNNDPAIREILWGYTYDAVSDTRTRPNHQALHGFTAPVNDSRWSNVMPPNGFNCRCQAIEVFKDELPERIEPQTEVTIGGDTMPAIPQADKGWGFNPADAFAAVTAE